MTMFIKLENDIPVGYAVTEENLQQLFPDHIFPKIYTPKDIRPLGFGIYEWTQIPQAEYPNKVVEVTPTLGDNGIYYQTWTIQEMSQTEKQSATEKKTIEVRAERNYKLMFSDWTQLADAPLSQEQKQAWNIYRQALRDITSQAGFPWNISWPTQPE